MNELAAIFLLENNTDYIYLLQKAFAAGGIKNRLKIVRYGTEAILYLMGTGIYADRRLHPMPGIILLDLTLPDGSGLTVLRWIRKRAEFASIPILALVGPTQSALLREALDLGANACLVKRDELSELVSVIQSLTPCYAVMEKERSPKTFPPLTALI